MHEAIEKREFIVLDGLGMRIQGTYHRPADRLFRSPVSRSNLGRPGVLFLNSLSLPRAASGDSAVQWASAVAEQGYPSFRIDLPGLGDSEGEASTDLLEFINAGGFASAAAAVAKQLVERFGLSGVVIFGHCAGSTSALYAGAACRECQGLILLDPYFHLPQARRPKLRQELSDWARRSRVGRFLSNLRDRAKKLILLLRGSAPPASANSKLLARWKQVAAAGVPILLLKAPGIKAHGSKPRVGEFDYIQHVVKLAGRKGRVLVKFVACADHSFANCEAREAVQRHIESWLAGHFPLKDFNRDAEGALPSRACDKQSGLRDAETAHADIRCAFEGR